MCFPVLFLFLTFAAQLKINPKMKPNQHCVYVKLPVYVGQFVRHIFHSSEGHIELPDATEIHSCFISYLTENMDMKNRDKKRVGGRERDKLSYSEVAYSLGAMKNRPKGTYRMKAPKKCELDNLFPFSIPNKIWRKNGMIDTNDYYELSLRGGREFRKMCTDLFWSSLRSYIVGQEREAYRLGKVFNKSLTIEKFLNFHKVEYLQQDTIIRTYTRKYSNVHHCVC